MKHTDTAVVYIITHLELGGAQKVCLALMQGLHGTQSTTYLIAGKEGVLVDKVQGNERVILLDTLRRNIGIKALWQEIKTFIQIIKELKNIKKKHAHVIVHTHCTKAGILGRWAAWFAGIKKRIHTIHGFAFHTHQSRIAWWLIYAAELVTSFITTHFVCVSTADITMANALFPRFAKKVSLIRAAVDWEPFYLPARSCLPEKRNFVFGTIACLKKQKNLFDLLYAFKLAHQHYPQSRLELIGDGILRPAIESWIAQHGLSSVVTLHGWQDSVAPLMMQWNAFVLSSLWEGLPCAVIEARLLKLPVLSYATGGIPEVIVSGENGFLYPQKNWQALAQGMISLIQSPTLYEQLRNFDDKLDDFKQSNMLIHHQNLYQSH